MNKEKALKILNLNNDYTIRDLKRKYYKYALKYHPDKNKNELASEKFKLGTEAYKFLQKERNMNEEIKLDYFSIIENFILNYIPEKIDKYLNTEFSLNIFNNLSKKSAIDIYTFLYNNKYRLPISEEILENMYLILKEKTNDSCLIILNPSLEDLLKDNVFKLELNGITHYIPLWHKQIFIKKTIINCIPDLDKKYMIDYNNNLYIKHSVKLCNILKNNFLEIKILDNIYKIKVNELKIKKNQDYRIKNKGILKINKLNMFSTEKRADIIFNIELEF